MKNKITVSQKPFDFLSYSEKTNSIVLLGFLMPQLIMLIVTKSWWSLTVAASTTAAFMTAEWIEHFWTKKSSFNFITASIQGILTGLFLPSVFPFYQAFLIALAVAVCVKYFVGGHTDSWINLPALTVCICWILSSALFPSYQISREVLSARNPALELIQNGTFPTNSLDTRITTSLNKTIFSLFGVSIPDGYVSLFWDTHSTVAAFRFNFITLITSIILISADIVKALVPGVYALVYGLLVYFAAPLLYGALPGQGDLLLAFCTSGFMLSTLFLLQCAGKAPMTTAGKIVYAVFGGIMAFIIMGVGTSPSGAAFTILMMNVISPVIQTLEHKAEMKKVRSQLLDRVKELKEGTNA